MLLCTEYYAGGGDKTWGRKSGMEHGWMVGILNRSTSYSNIFVGPTYFGYVAEVLP